jgi:hypothetical protein
LGRLYIEELILIGSFLLIKEGIFGPVQQDELVNQFTCNEFMANENNELNSRLY